MSQDATRIGTRRLKRKPSRRLPLILLAIAATGLIALGAIAAAYTFGGTVADTSAAPSPSPMDEEGFCALMVPTGGEAAELVAAYATEATRDTVNWTKMEQVSNNLKTIRDIATGERRADVEAHIAAVDAILDMRRSGFARNLDLEPFRAAGLRTAGLCMKYAS